MKTPVIASATIAALAALSSSASLSAQTSINLTQDATVRQAGTYTYYARGNAAGTTITPFTTMFYPGGVLHTYAGGDTVGRDGVLTDNGSNGAPISFGSGELTDNSTTSEVRGWIDIEQVSYGTHSPNPHGGVFDIVFDLGANYVITSVDVTYTDASGWRFSTTVDGQRVFTSTANPSSTGDAGLSLFDTGTASSNATKGTLAFSGTSVSAQYVIFRPEMSVATNVGGNSYGGYIYEVAINGYAVVPEPSSFAALAGLTVLGGCLMRRRRRSV